MKFSSLIFLCAAFQPYAKANEMSCVTNVVDGKDYFPHKAVPEDSQQWSVTYENTYKIVSNPAAGESYLLYQCGTEPPVDQLDGRHAAVLSVPLEEVGVLSTTMLPFIEILGAREKIAAFLGSSAWVSSVCIGELFDQGLLEEVPDPYNATKITNVPLDLPSFVGNFGGTALQTEIKVSVTEEVKNLAAFEWIKFYSLFFNMEESANDIFDATKGRYSCAEENAGLIACGDEKRPVVLWGSYSDFCQGWDVASCPNYYCEFAEVCQSELLNSDDRGSLFSETCGRNYMTTEEFIEFGQDADIWIYTSPDFDNALANFGANLTDFVSIQNEQVYDTEGQGAGAWFEQRLAEPDVVLQDFCNLVGHENLAVPNPHQRAWFRNVFTEPIGSLGQCEDPAAPLVTKATTCVALPSTSCEDSIGSANAGSDDSLNDEPGSSAEKASALLALTFATLAAYII